MSWRRKQLKEKKERERHWKDDLPCDIWSLFQMLMNLTTDFRPFSSLRADIQNNNIIMALKRALRENLM